MMLELQRKTKTEKLILLTIFGIWFLLGKQYNYEI